MNQNPAALLEGVPMLRDYLDLVEDVDLGTDNTGEAHDRIFFGGEQASCLELPAL